MSELVHDLIFDAARRAPHAPALSHGAARLDYAALAHMVDAAAQALLATGLGRGERVAIYLEKRVENVAAMFGAAAAGGVFVPVNPQLKPDQVVHILTDCNVRILLTSAARLAQLAPLLPCCVDLHTILLVDGDGDGAALPHTPARRRWALAAPGAGVAQRAAHRRIDADVAAILYTSGSTGKPKGVVLSHRNLVAGASSVALYLALTPADRILSVLPLSFDYGLSQLTSAFCAGAAVVLMNYLFPRDIAMAIEAERITGLAAVPPLWQQLAQLAWPASTSLRFLTNSGGAMPRATLDALRAALPSADIYLMYGLTEAFRSTYLAPCELDRRPDSIGRAIPNAHVMVVRGDGTACAANEPGELVHRGALVALGYWNDPAKTAERFRPAPGQDPALPLVEMAVWSGDIVRQDEEGFFYFLGRNDDMIKVSGYRVSPSEIEDIAHGSGLVAEAVAFGVAHPLLGQAIVLLAVARDPALSAPALSSACARRLPAYMVPAHIALRSDPFPRNPNGKIDRALLRAPFRTMFESK
ncbi:MAG: acyl-CoA ligase (AMP-forming), exosortase A system-associated [Massilia sp.]|nr:acyl-CoA ligase (AMP-forming), exosortase A system-associated [Massilia sp.]